MVSKVFEKFIQKQLNNYISKFLSPFLCVKDAVLNLFDKFNRKIENFPSSERIYRCSVDGLIKTI